jgi:lysophospholipase L1-like esterase
VLIWKRTEAEVGVVSFHGFDLDKEGGLQNLPPPRARHILVIGDSTAAGYGNEGANGSCHGSASRENNYCTYGAYAARELDATYVAVAWSGKGLTRNYETRDVLTLPAVYDRTIPTEKESPRVSASEPADVIVLNLGTNDLFLGVPDEHAFIAAYRTFVGSLRARHPDALIVLVLGPMLADDYPQPNARSLMRSWLAKVREEMQARGDAKVESIEQSIDPAEGVGCDFHPNTKTHARLGHELATLIRGRLEW